MSACCPCGHRTCDAETLPETLSKPQVRPGLFNWLTVLLLTGWIGIVTFALETAGPDKVSAMPTLEGFLRVLLS